MADTGRWFDAAWYLLRNPDVVRVGIEPLAHYARYGEAEGRRPSPWFDPVWYRETHAIPADQLALDHFLAHGEFAPCAELYSIPHLPPWRDLDDPFARYLDDMEEPGRELLPDLSILRSSGLIEARYHVINGLDAFEAELEPSLHYCRFGWRQGARPNTAFDPAWYKVPTQINPLMHYILEGEPSGLRPVPWFDPVWYRNRHGLPAGQSSLGHYLANRLSGEVSPNPLFDAAWYKRQHGGSIPDGVDPFTHYLLAGAIGDVDPSPHFDARLWRHRHLAPLGAPGQERLPVEARNPLVHCLTQQETGGARR